MPLLTKNCIKYEFVFFPPPYYLSSETGNDSFGETCTFVPIHIPHNEMHYYCENVVECLLD